MMRRATCATLGGVFAGACSATVAIPSATLMGARRNFTEATTVRKPHALENISYSLNESYMADIVKQYESDPTKVDKSWHVILEELKSADPDTALIQTFNRPFRAGFSTDAVASAKECADNMKLAWMVRAYEMKGHLISDLDPLGMYEADLDGSIPIELEPSTFGFTDADMEQAFRVSVGPNFGGLVTAGNTPMKLREIVALLKATYCEKVGFEFMHAGFSETRVWFRQQILNSMPVPSKEVRIRTLEEIIRAERFEKILHLKYQTAKRFGLDGAETLIAAMNATIDRGAKHGVRSFVIGMPHRGRLNTLVNVCGKELARVFSEFEGRADADLDVPGTASGDVKYHMGTTNEMKTSSGDTVTVSLLANPSHLECVNPLVMGKVKAKQHFNDNGKHDKTIPILMHGDAAFAGQGVCYESMGLASLENYNVGGTIHIVVNNQVGFTTNPNQSRSAPYCTDLAKTVNAPVFHVNGDCPDQVVRVAEMAMEYRMKFKKDVIIDLVCYRRYGHNETDQPMFTQPLMYTKVAKHPTILTKYGDELIRDGVLTQDELKAKIFKIDSGMRKQFDLAQSEDYLKSHKFKEWTAIDSAKEDKDRVLMGLQRDTGMALETLRQLGTTLTTIPEGFHAHSTVKNVFAKRAKALAAGTNIDWAFAEQLAFGTLALSGNHVRIAGQDVERGTFAQRHAKIHDQTTGESYVPLEHIHSTQSQVMIGNSSLSEFGVCGYECGYALENPRSFVMWEAQFGDFSNGAQVIFDQFLASGEAKWIRQCLLTISLPHGYDGQGPEHSSGRLERYLQLSDCPDTVPADFNPADWQSISEKRIKEQNWQITFPTVSSNYFHLIRRQVSRDFRKPLINFFSKALLRAELANSDLANFDHGKSVKCVLDHPTEVAKVRKVIFCTGQVANKLFQAQSAKDAVGRDDVAIVRLEQIAPFCWEPIHDILQKYNAGSKNGVEIVWAQEEPKNMGAWSFVRVRMNNLLKHMKIDDKISFVGRPSSASPAPGHAFMFAKEEAAIVDGVFKK